MKPQTLPLNPSFSSGPCPKYLGWSLSNIKLDTIGRSHRSKIGKNHLKYCIEY